MRVVISICKHELELADRWFDWCLELGGTEGHSLHLIPSSGTDIKNVFEKANRAFHNQVSVQIDYEAETSDWQSSELMRSASGPNSSFRQVAWDFEHFKKGHWFWCEVDCIPLKRDWLDRLEAEYKVAVSKGKVFMGAHVLIDKVAEHMSGNAVYPENTPSEAPRLVRRTNYTTAGQPKPLGLAFDVAGAPDVLPKAYWTNLIQHKFRYGKFETKEQFDAVIDPNAVVFHSCKDGSIFKYLRENLGGVVKSEQHSPTKAISSPHSDAPSALNLDDVVEPYIKEWQGLGTTESYVSTGGVGEGVMSVHDNRPVDAGFTVNQQPKVTSRTFNPDELLEIIAQNSVIKNGLPAMSPPWENREDTEADVKMLCNALALFCKAPIYKSRVRNALREAKIIK